MKITIEELNAIKTLLTEEYTRIGKYNKLIHKDYKKNIVNLIKKVNTEIKKVNTPTKTKGNGVKKYTFF